jgi:DNA-binding transcriptional ArsR family regulator
MIFEALAASTRRAILVSLRDDESTPSALAAHLDMSRPAVSNHLRILRDAGLVRSRRHGQMRLYSLETKAFREAALFVCGLPPEPLCPACPDRPFCRRGPGAF